MTSWKRQFATASRLAGSGSPSALIHLPQLLFDIGTLEPTPTDATPGNADTASIVLRAKVSRAASSGYLRSGSCRLAAITCSTRNPGSTWFRARRLRSRSPAPARRTTESATSATTSAERSRPVRGDTVAAPSLSASESEWRDSSSAGARPNATPVTRESASAPRCAARKQEVCQVRAGDQEHHRHGSEQQKQRRAEGAGHCVAERLRDGALSHVVRELAGERFGDADEVLLCAFEAHPRLEPRDHLREMVSAGEHVAVGLERDRCPQLDGRIVEGESLRHHADHGPGFTVERDRLSQHAGIAGEVPHPEPVREHRHLMSAPLLLLGREEAAEARLEAERRRELMGRPVHQDPLGLAACDPDVAPGRVVRSHRRERLRAIAIRPEIGERHAHLRIRGRHRPDENQPLWIAIGQRTQEHRVDGGEERRVRAEAERKREHGRRRESRAAAESAKCIEEILQHRFTPPAGRPRDRRAGPAAPGRRTLSPRPPQARRPTPDTSAGRWR